MKTMTIGDTVIVELGNPDIMRTETDLDSGSLICWRDFSITRTGHAPHRVSVEIDEDGYSQEARCDCQGLAFRGRCRHVDLIYSSGVLDEAESE